ncbi:hypothetical protein DPMN_172430, partial [Dreissena polymorpha]
MGVSSIDCQLEVDVHYVAAWGKLLFSESGHLSKPDKQPAGGSVWRVERGTLQLLDSQGLDVGRG